jgi:Fe-S-cluster containining protein
MLTIEKSFPITSKTEQELFFPCFRCGICCTRYQARLSRAEALKIAEYMGISWRSLLERYMDQRWPGRDSFLLRQEQGTCIFLKGAEGSNERSCLIHSCKPVSCMEWTPGLHRRECREGLAGYWGLTVNSSGELQGEKEKILSFQTFLKSISRKDDDQNKYIS